jgi:HCOMODA/2-hydroxy-3-carboxy-muconic semialdehyde decarboxylase
MTIVPSVRRSGPLFALCMVLALCLPAAAQQAPASAGPPDPTLVEDLVAAYRILADHGLLDGWGHVSVRHDKDPNRYLMARGMSADMVTAKDIIEFDLDSRPVDTHGLPISALFTERYIHGEIYKMRPDVVAVVHTHAPSLIPFGDTKVPLKPMYHRAAFIAFGIPVFEIRERAGMTDMLIRNAGLGHDLAEALGDHPAILMRGHGAAITAPTASSPPRCGRDRGPRAFARFLDVQLGDRRAHAQQRVVARTIFLSLDATLHRR